MAMLLEGIRIIDWTIFQQGPVVGAMLGDLGAEIIKIEEKGRGDPGRGMLAVVGHSTQLPGGRNYYFETNNRNKKSIALNLKQPRAREVVYRLVERSDVFVQNFRMGVAERLGMDYESLSRVNARLIYARASGFGPEGPDSHRPSLDPVGVARSGFMDTLVGEDGIPCYPQSGIADQIGAIMLAYGILAALIARERLGVGQIVDSSHLSAMMWLQSLAIHFYLMQGKALPGWRRKRAANPMNNFYLCADRKWVFLALTQPERHWLNFCQAIGHAELETDPRFDTTEKRRQRRTELVELLDRVFAQKTSLEWECIFLKFRDFVFERVKSIPELVEDPQVMANQYITDYDHPTLGKIKLVSPPVSFSRTPAGVQSPAPEYGQHTEEVLTGICGYSWEEIASLKEQGVTD